MGLLRRAWRWLVGHYEPNTWVWYIGNSAAFAADRKRTALLLRGARSTKRCSRCGVIITPKIKTSRCLECR